MFSNVNRSGEPRHWRLGQPFADVAARFYPKLRKPLPGSARAMKALGLTRGYRTEYDHAMLSIHDAMKRAAVQWGIGRYLYNLPRTLARIADDGDKSAPFRGEVKDPTGKKVPFRWYAPTLPDWALPK